MMMPRIELRVISFTLSGPVTPASTIRGAPA
jgi:hypothetical protein